MKIIFWILFVLIAGTGSVHAQQINRNKPFVIRNPDGSKPEISRIVVHVGSMSYDFKMDSASSDYQSLSGADPKWFKSINLIKWKYASSGTPVTVLEMTLKKNKLKKLSIEFRRKFH